MTLTATLALACAFAQAAALQVEAPVSVAASAEPAAPPSGLEPRLLPTVPRAVLTPESPAPAAREALQPQPLPGAGAAGVGEGAVPMPRPAPETEPQPETPDEAPGDAAAAEVAEALEEVSEEGLTEPAAEAASPLEEAGLEEAGLEVTATDEAVVARDGQGRWRLDFAPNTGPTSNLLATEAGLFVGRGNSVLRLDRAGRVQARWLVSGPIEELRLEAPAEASAEAPAEHPAIAVLVRHPSGVAERFSLRGGALSPVPRFSLDPEVYEWLAREGAHFGEARLAQDATNPWLHLAVGARLQEENRPDEARASYREALDRAATFYDLAGLSRALFERGEAPLADEAWEAAMVDFAARDYTPWLLTDPALHRAYNFPLDPLRQALAEGDLRAADYWAPRLWLVSPNVAGAHALYHGYAEGLRGAGRHEEARIWQTRARGTVRQVAGTGLERVMSSLGRVGWTGALAILVAILLLHLTLLLKYWLPQGHDLRERARLFASRGKTFPPRRRWLGRLLAVRYYSLSERLVLILMFAASAALAALAGWVGTSDRVAPELRAGTLASAEAREHLEGAPLHGPLGDFIRGYAAHTGGDGNPAASYYRRAGDYPPALNNLGVLEGDPALIERALERSPGLLEARHNLGESVRDESLSFALRYGGPELLVAPGQQDLVAAREGSWEVALRRAFINPWLGLGTAPPGLPAPVWYVLLSVLVLWALFNLLALVLPRPKSARNAPRTTAYHALALLVPGSSQAAEAWGLLLIVPWALLGLHALALLFGWPFSFGLSLPWTLVLLALLYLVNVASFAVEFAVYRRRVAAQRRREQEVWEYGV